MKTLHDYKIHEQFNNILLITQATAKITKTNKVYITLSLRDSSEELTGNVWTNVEPTTENINALEASYASGNFIRINANISEYNGKRQLTINEATLVPKESTEIDPLQFVASAPKTKNQLELTTNDLIESITNETWHKIVKTLYQNNKSKYLSHPAAKSVHHAVYSGLAFHSTSIALDADAIAKLYPQINRDLLVSGALIHDMGKIIELSGPIATEYTFDGKMFGHIVILNDMLDAIINADPIYYENHKLETTLLKHMILSHHGKLEWGSPVQPHLLEAQILHQLDALDANIFAISSALAETQNGQWSNKIYSLDNQEFYKIPDLNKTL